jgi:hypothetical protein
MTIKTKTTIDGHPQVSNGSTPWNLLCTQEKVRVHHAGLSKNPLSADLIEQMNTSTHGPQRCFMYSKLITTKKICPLLPNINQIMYNNEKLFINFDVFFGDWYRYRS